MDVLECASEARSLSITAVGVVAMPHGSLGSKKSFTASEAWRRLHEDAVLVHHSAEPGRSSRLSNHHLGARFWQNVCGVDSTVSEAAGRSGELSPEQRPRAALTQSKPDLRVADSQEICRSFHETLR